MRVMMDHCDAKNLGRYGKGKGRDHSKSTENELDVRFISTLIHYVVVFLRVRLRFRLRGAGATMISRGVYVNVGSASVRFSLR